MKEFLVIQFPENNEFELSMAIFDSKTDEFLIIKLPQNNESQLKNSQFANTEQIKDKLKEFIEKSYDRKVKNFFEHTLHEGKIFLHINLIKSKLNLRNVRENPRSIEKSRIEELGLALLLLF